MKKNLPLLLLLMVCMISSHAQNSYSYYFNNNLQGTNGAPDLRAVCPGSVSYTPTDFSSMGGGVRPTLNISPGCGLLFADSTGLLRSGSSYTIVMYLQMQNVVGYRKLVDYKNLRLDNGLYSLGGELGFYGSPVLFSNNIFTDSTFFSVVISRDSATAQVDMYAYAQHVGSFADTSGLAVFEANRLLYFLMDDSNTNTENMTGQIAMLRIFDYALDSAQSVHQTSVSTLLAVNEVSTEQSSVKVYPNPASTTLQIAYTTPSAAMIDIYSIDGRLVEQDQISRSGAVSVSGLPAGMYTVCVRTESGSSYHKVIKQ